MHINWQIFFDFSHIRKWLHIKDKWIFIPTSRIFTLTLPWSHIYMRTWIERYLVPLLACMKIQTKRQSTAECKNRLWHKSPVKTSELELYAPSIWTVLKKHEVEQKRKSKLRRLSGRLETRLGSPLSIRNPHLKDWKYKLENRRNKLTVKRMKIKLHTI